MASFVSYVGKGIGQSLADLIPSGRFLTDLNRVMLITTLRNYAKHFVLCILFFFFLSFSFSSVIYVPQFSRIYGGSM